MNKEDKVILIEKGVLFIFYDDNNVKALDIASGNFMDIEGIQATIISNIIYKRYSELNDSELKLVEEFPYFIVKDVKHAKDSTLLAVVHEIERELVDTYGLDLHKINECFYKVFSLRRHLWITYQQGYLLPISLKKGYSMLSDLSKDKDEILCLGDDDLMCAFFLLESSKANTQAYIADIDDALLRFYKNVVKPLVPHKEIITMKKDFTKINQIDLLDENKKVISFTNPPTRIDILKKFLRLAAKHSKYTLLPSSFPHLLRGIIPFATIYRLSPLSAFSLRFVATNNELVIDTTHVGPVWTVIKWQKGQS